MAGLALLTVAPLLSATASLTFTLCEDTFVRPMMHSSERNPSLRASVNHILPSQNRWTRRGLSIVFTTYPLSIATAIANLTRHDKNVDLFGTGNPRLTAGFYLAGLVFSVLHFPFGPKAMSYLKIVKENKGVDEDPKRDNTAAMEAWLKINALRGVVADIPSWVCYFTAFLLAMS